MPSPRSRLALATILLSLAPAAQAQNQSEGYKFLEAVRGEKGNEIEEMLNKPGSVVINTRSVTDGETPLHVVTKAGNADYLNYLLSRGANPNVRDNAGTAPLVLAADRGREDLVRAFIKYKANVNYGNSNGETALIKAVRRRDLALIRTLLEAGANPDQADLLAGMSARDYAAQDTRAPAVAKELAATPIKPKAAVSGPRF
jgi:ankyrin repeat protein